MMADAFDCGKYVHDAWRRGVAYQCRWLGAYDPSMGFEEIHARQEHHKLTAEFREALERGFNAGRAEHQLAPLTLTEVNR